MKYCSCCNRRVLWCIVLIKNYVFMCRVIFDIDSSYSLKVIVESNSIILITKSYLLTFTFLVVNYYQLVWQKLSDKSTFCFFFSLKKLHTVLWIVDVLWVTTLASFTNNDPKWWIYWILITLKCKLHIITLIFDRPKLFCGLFMFTEIIIEFCLAKRTVKHFFLLISMEQNPKKPWFYYYYFLLRSFHNKEIRILYPFENCKSRCTKIIVKLL